MKKSLICFALGGLLLSLAGCRQPYSLSPEQLEGSWNIVKVRANAVPADAQPAPFIDFDYARKSISGNAGCNRMMAQFSVDSLREGSLSFGPIASTRMACPDMSLEANILEALSEVASFRAVHSAKDEETAPFRLALCSEEGEELLLLEKAPAATDGAAALEGYWAIRTVEKALIDPSENTPYLAFNPAENTVYGNAGCNMINGSYQADDQGALSFGAMAATLMMCADMDTETAILRALGKVVSFRIEQDNLALCDSLGNAVLGLEKDNSLQGND